MTNRKKSHPLTAQSSDSERIPTKFILFFLLLMTLGFVLTSTGTDLAGFRDILFGSGVVAWIVGIFGAFYCAVRRVAGPKSAKIAVLVLFLMLLSQLIFSKQSDKDHNSFEGVRK